MAAPIKYKPEFCDKVKQYGKEGMSKTEMAANLGISKDSFFEYEKEYVEFSDSVKEAIALSQAWWEQKGRTATFKSKHFNGTTYIFNMKNRFKDDWSDMSTVNHNGLEGLYALVAGTTAEIPENRVSSERSVLETE